MLTTDFRLKDVVNFLLLNAGFIADKSLQHGKIAVALFLYYAQKHKMITARSEIADAFLEAIIRNDNSFNSGTYAEGTAGMCVVLEHLRQAGFILYDPEFFLKDYDYGIIYDNRGKVEQIDIAGGLSGNGLYMLHRFYEAATKRSSAENYYKVHLLSYIKRVVESYPFYRANEYLYQVDANIWNGLTGVLLFLNRSRELDIYCNDSEKLEMEIVHKLVHHVNNNFCWSNAEAFVGLLHSKIVCSNAILQKEIFGSFRLFIDNAKKHLQSIDFRNAAFIAVLIRLLGRKYNYAPAVELSDVLSEDVKVILAKGDMAALFNSYPGKKTFQMGIYRGVCGTALSLLSVQTEDYSWLKILGIEVS